MWKIYMMLSRVEDGFKSLKSELKIRPIYHQLSRREENLRLGNEKRGWKKIKEILKTQQVVSIEIPSVDEIYTIRVVTEADEEQKEIYKKLKLDGKILPKRIIAVKR